MLFCETDQEPRATLSRSPRSRRSRCRPSINHSRSRCRAASNASTTRTIPVEGVARRAAFSPPCPAGPACKCHWRCRRGRSARETSTLRASRRRQKLLQVEDPAAGGTGLGSPGPLTRPRHLRIALADPPRIGNFAQLRGAASSPSRRARPARRAVEGTPPQQRAAGAFSEFSTRLCFRSALAAASRHRRCWRLERRSQKGTYRRPRGRIRGTHREGGTARHYRLWRRRFQPRRR